MKYLLKNSSKPDTEIIIGKDSLDNLGVLCKGYTKIVMITDKDTQKNCLGLIEGYLPEDHLSIVLEAGEKNKDLETVKSILKQLRECGCDRKSLVVGLGGGVVNDIAGFAASIFMRGVDWLMIPTTLVAQADASIGGKTGVNLEDYKNMAGTFWPSRAVLINPAFLKTLPDKHLRNGLAEIIKMGIIYNRRILEYVDNLDVDKLLTNDLTEAANLATAAKVQIVNSDMYEAGERKLLNFGHTIGHGVESISLHTDKPLLHGEAIAVGMVAEARLAELEGIGEAGLSQHIANLLQKFNLPVSFSANPEELMNKIASDKKNVGQTIYWTLPKAIGTGMFNHKAADKNIDQALRSVISP